MSRTPLILTDTAHSMLAFGSAMLAWEKSLTRPDLDERARVAGALLAYQRQLFACQIADNQTGVNTNDAENTDARGPR